MPVFTVEGPAGESVSFTNISAEQLNTTLTNLESSLKEAKRKDQVEADDAMKKYGGGCNGHKDFKGEIDKITGAADKAMEALWTHYTTSFEPKANVVDSLMTSTSKMWTNMSKDVGEQSTIVSKHLGLDDWKSQGAAGYKKAIEGQNNALIELRDLAKQNAVSVQNVAMLNAAIFSITWHTLLGVSIPQDAIDTTTCWCKRKFFVRTDTARVRLENAGTFVSKIVTTKGEWYPTSSQITAQLTLVQSSGQNLNTDTWPEASGSAAQTAAHTGNVSVNEDDMTSGDSGGSSDGTKI